MQEEINGYIQNSDGKWVLSEKAKQESLELYYSCRLAYDPMDLRFSIGKYSPTGEVIPFKTHIF